MFVFIKFFVLLVAAFDIIATLSILSLEVSSDIELAGDDDG
jgi:ABC-type lipoprotein release transport system permease subunit